MNKDLLILKERYVAGLLGRDFDDNERFEEIKSIAIPGQYEGSIRFSDVDYESKETGAWSTAGHVGRMVDLAIIYARGKYSRIDEVEKMFLAATDEWIKADYLNSNWWHNEISVAGMMTDIGLLAWDLLDEQQKKKVDEICSRGSFRYNESAKRWTGANQLWGVDTAAKHAIILDDAEYMQEIADRMYEEIAFAKEGIQKDGTYFQHGPRLYAGGYGRIFVSSLANMVGKFDGTAFELPPEKVDILEFHLLDGLRWMIHKDMYDWVACGREFSRPGWGGAGMIAGAVRNFCKLGAFVRKDELTAFADAVEEKRPAVQGVKYFPDSTLLCAHIDDIYIGFKGIDAHSVIGETCNGEGCLCANMSYGTTTTVMRTGQEYARMSPVWNYCRVPGTTTRDEYDDELIVHGNDCNKFQTGDRFDGGQLGDCAYSSQTVVHNGIKATVVAFGTPFGVAILGSGIASDRKETLTTTVEQCGRVTEVIAGDDLVIHNGVKYVNLDKQNKFVTTCETREGSWSRNNRTLGDDKETVDVFMLELDRGHDGYAYLIQPETVSGEFEVIENTEDIQAVRLPDGRVLVHFFADGEITVDGKRIAGRMHDCVALDK